MHQEFGWQGKEREELDDISVRNRAKLVLLNIGAFPELLKDTNTARRQIGNIVYTIRHNMLHVRGTIALLVPHPWVVHGGRLHGESAKLLRDRCLLSLLAIVRVQ